MDPNATLERWERACNAQDGEEAQEAYDDLKRWISRGGFEPDWSKSYRAQFMKWKNRLR